MEAELTLTVTDTGPGFLVALRSTGDYSSDAMNRRFYSFVEQPPDDLVAQAFWSEILRHIAVFLADQAV
jgi:hypothetical protein